MARRKWTSRAPIRKVKNQRLIEPWLQPEFVDQSEQSAANDDRYDVPFPTQHPDERDRANNDGKPVDRGATGKKCVEREPDGEIHHHSDNSRGDRGKRGRQFHVASQLLDMWSA